jgi:hypothetical protein
MLTNGTEGLDHLAETVITLLVAFIPIFILLYFLRLMNTSLGLFFPFGKPKAPPVVKARKVEVPKEDPWAGDLTFRHCPNCNCYANLPKKEDAPWAVCEDCQEDPNKMRLLRLELERSWTKDEN